MRQHVRQMGLQDATGFSKITDDELDSIVKIVQGGTWCIFWKVNGDGSSSFSWSWSFAVPLTT